MLLGPSWRNPVAKASGNCVCSGCGNYYYYVDENNDQNSGWYRVGERRENKLSDTMKFERNTGYYNSRTSKYLCPYCISEPIPGYNPYNKNTMDSSANDRQRHGGI